MSTLPAIRAATLNIISRRGLPMRLRFGLGPAVAVGAVMVALQRPAWQSLLGGFLVFVVAYGFARLTLWPIEQMCRRVERIEANRLSERMVESRGTDAVAQLAKLLNRMLDRLEQSEEQQRRFVADAAHELRSPITATVALLDAALRQDDSDRWRSAARQALIEQQRLRRAVDDLLLLASAQERLLNPRSDEVDLDDTVLESALAIRSRGAIAIDTSAVTAARIIGDAHLLGSLVRNLLENSERHATSRIAVSLGASANQVTLTVDDDGPGVPPGDRERVFERFVQLDPTFGAVAGSAGLGLSMVRTIAQLHRATATISAAPIGGARFTVTFDVASI